jgi:hypothetical protein
MTFLDSLLNNKNDIDFKYQNEQNNWSSFRQIKDFNKRRCNCCTCLQDIDDDNNTYSEYQDNIGNIGNSFMCSTEYEREMHNDNNEDTICQCSCLYPTIVDPIILNTDNMITLIYYLKNKNIQITGNDFEYDNKDSEWNNLLIDILQVSDDDIERFSQEHSYGKMMVFARNWNVLNFIDGMGSLKYSS